MTLDGAVFVEQKPREGREVEATPDAVIGREGTDVVLQDPEVSRRHAAIRVQADGVAIEDLGSTNGTFVNDQRIEGLRPLSDGDVVRFGNTVWRLRAPVAAGATTVGQVQAAPPQVTSARPVPSDLPAPPAPPAAPPSPAPPSAAPVGSRGDVPAPPEVVPSAIRRVVVPPTPGNAPAFAPPAPRKGGSAATRVEATVVCLLFALAVAVAIAIYFASQG
jgi:predicted component of type VI protein secretion system